VILCRYIEFPVIDVGGMYIELWERVGIDEYKYMGYRRK